MIELPQVTIIAVAGNRQGETLTALYKCMRQVKAAKVVMITNVDLQAEGIEVVNVGGLKTWQEYNHFIVKELYKYFDTSHCLIVQWDGYILDGSQWDSDFLEYDIIGAWGLYNDARNNLNGGFSIRSYKLQKALAVDKEIDITSPEDEIICRLYRYYIEKKYQIKFAPEEICNKFSYEMREPVQPTFGFHAFHFQPYRPHIVIKRNHAMGDVIMAEPLIEYYCKKGYQVVLDTQDQCYPLFNQYPYQLKKIQQLSPNIVPEKVINLDMAYEIKPRQLVLKSYYEMAGVKDGEYRNSRLYMHQSKEQKLFEKYILIHHDDTLMSHRNSHGINWNLVVNYFHKLGYLVFQIGHNRKEIIAPYFNAMTKEMLMYAVKGADLFIGIDSGLAQISVGFNRPTVIMTGSVDLKYRYPDFTNIQVVQSDCPKEELKNCYHIERATTVGVKCEIDEQLPPCTIHSEWSIIQASNKLLENAGN